MAKEDDAWRRFRDREDETAKDEAPSLREKRLNSGLPPKPGSALSGSVDLEKLMQQIEPLIEQVGNLYAQFFAGVEKRLPLEKRKLLDALVAQLLSAAKNSPGLQFRCQTIIQRHQTHKDRWERLIKDFEDGKTRR